MIRRHWNGLRVGHYVLVHDDNDPQMTLAPGRVTKIDQTTGSYDVTIRISPLTGSPREVQPSRLAVHLDTGEGTERCWRCETHYPERAHAPNTHTSRNTHTSPNTHTSRNTHTSPNTHTSRESTMPDKKPQHPAGKPAAKSLKEKRATKREKQRSDRSAPT